MAKILPSRCDVNVEGESAPTRTYSVIAPQLAGRSETADEHLEKVERYGHAKEHGCYRLTVERSMSVRAFTSLAEASDES